MKFLLLIPLCLCFSSCTPFSNSEPSTPETAILTDSSGQNFKIKDFYWNAGYIVGTDVSTGKRIVVGGNYTLIHD